jgi:hypothetical protein
MTKPAKPGQKEIGIGDPVRVGMGHPFAGYFGTYEGITPNRATDEPMLTFSVKGQVRCLYPWRPGEPMPFYHWPLPPYKEGERLEVIETGEIGEYAGLSERGDIALRVTDREGALIVPYFPGRKLKVKRAAAEGGYKGNEPGYLFGVDRAEIAERIETMTQAFWDTLQALTDEPEDLPKPPKSEFEGRQLWRALFLHVAEDLMDATSPTARRFARDLGDLLPDLKASL